MLARRAPGRRTYRHAAKMYAISTPHRTIADERPPSSVEPASGRSRAQPGVLVGEALGSFDGRCEIDGKGAPTCAGQNCPTKPVNPGVTTGAMLKLGESFLPESNCIRSLVSWMVLRSSARLYLAT
jgi:hypothetical protein